MAKGWTLVFGFFVEYIDLGQENGGILLLVYYGSDKKA